MIYIETYVDCNYAGCNETGYFSFDDDTNEDVIQEFVSDWAMGWAEEYEYACIGDDEAFDDNLVSEYYDNIYFNYKIISEKEFLGKTN